MKMFISLCLTLLLSLGLFVSVSAEEGKEITFTEFIETIETNGEFDGQGATVRWSPDEDVVIVDRVQKPNAQYQIASGKDFDIVIKNTTFIYDPDDIPNHSDGWSGHDKNWTKEQIRNAEFQFLNTGDVTVENCTFEKIIVSPYGKGNDSESNSDRNFTVKNSTFSNVYNAYALKDIYTANALIEGNTFTNCGAAIYFEGGVERGTIVIKDNKFDNIDTNAADGKAGTRGLIQFSAAFVVADNTSFTFEGSEVSGNLFKSSSSDKNNLMGIRQISPLHGLMIQNWTLGEAFSLHVEGENLSLPDMPSGENEKGTYTFMGWASDTDYNGPTDITNADSFLKAKQSGLLNQYYYAVWEFVPNEEETVPLISCAGEKDKNCDGVVTCDEEMGEGWTWNNDKGVCEYNGTSSYVVVNTAVK